MTLLKLAALLFLLLYLAPLGVAALLHQRTSIGADWWSADRSSTGLLPPATSHRPAVVRVFAAPTVRWRGIFAVHSWIVLKPDGDTAYTWRNRGDYRVWPGPNSNTFVAAVLDAVPEAQVTLPPTAIGKDYPYDGRWVRLTASGTGVRLSLGGAAGVTVGWVEGIEVNILGGVAGIDFRRPALKLPGLGRIGLATAAPG